MTFSKQTLDALDATLNETCKSAQIPGMALIVSQNGLPVFEKYYGYRDVGEQLPVIADTLFGVASITKSFAALAIMQLEDAGKLTVDDAVVGWLPEFRLPSRTYTERVTIHHLLTHTAGLPGMDAVNQARAESIQSDPDGEYLFGKIPSKKRPVRTVVDVMDVMAETDYTLLGAPGEGFNYSNESYALLQEIIERASDQSFITYMEKHILQPLQMNRSVFLTDDLTHTNNVTELYAYTKGKDKTVFHSPVWWDVGDVYANGSLKASAADLMNYLEVYRLAGLVNGERIVSERSIRKMTAPHITLPNGNQYGYGLQVRSHAGVTFVGHGGGIKGVSSNMQVAKEQGITACVLTNLADVAAEDLAFTAINHLLDLKDVEALPDYPVEQEQMEKYTGHYQSMEGQELSVSIKDDRLQLDIESKHIPVIPYATDCFVTADGKKIVFRVDDQGEVAGVFRGMRFIPKV